MPNAQLKPKSNAQQAKGRRKRRPAKAVAIQPGPPKAPPSRTTASLENSLRTMKISKPMSVGSDWAMCRLQPWNGLHGALMPDGTGDPRIVMDMYSWTDIAITGTANFAIRTLPALPFNAILIPQTTMNASITMSNGLPSTITPTIGQGGMYAYSGTIAGPIPIAATKASTQTHWSDNPALDDPKIFVTANKARITSMGWRLTYTGQASTCTGVVTTTSSPMVIDPIVPKQTGRVRYTVPDGTLGGAVDCGVTALKIVPTYPMFEAFAATGKDSIVLRPEVGARGLVRHSQPTYPFKEIQDQNLVLTIARDGVNQITGDLNALLNVNFPTTGIPVANGGTAVLGSLMMLDDDWDMTTINLTGVNGSYRFEVWTCVEYIPAPSSIMRDIATVSAKANIPLVSSASAAAAKAPVASPVNTT